MSTLRRGADVGTPISLFTVAVGVLTILGGANDCRAANEARVSSPDGSVQIQVLASGGRLTYAVTFKGRPVIVSSPLAVSVDGTDLTDGAELGDGKTDQV